MDAQKLRRLLRSAATGTVLLGLTVPATAGDICEKKDERPTVQAGCLPNWGFHQTCWKRMPPVPPCTTGFCDSSFMGGTVDPGMTGEVWTQSDGSTLYTPQSGVYVPGQSASSSPVSILPPSVQGRYAPSTGAMPGMTAPGLPSIVPPTLSPVTPVPQVPEGVVAPEAILPPAAVPAVPALPGPQVPVQGIPVPQPIPGGALPPLPTPPNGVPGQTLYRSHQQILGADGRPVMARTSVALPGAAASSRYGRAGHSMPIAPAQTPVFPAASRSNTPVRFASQPGTSNTSNRYGNGPAVSQPGPAPVVRRSPPRF
ncbi:MAG: hypothetical protein JNM43_26745 [Planctomycetaceae bacterium]|nr:hypothetical protein [Planctomycetaceae bacterium]